LVYSFIEHLKIINAIRYCGSGELVHDLDLACERNYLSFGGRARLRLLPSATSSD